MKAGSLEKFGIFFKNIVSLLLPHLFQMTIRINVSLETCDVLEFLNFLYLLRLIPQFSQFCMFENIKKF